MVSASVSDYCITVDKRNITKQFYSAQSETPILNVPTYFQKLSHTVVTAKFCVRVGCTESFAKVWKNWIYVCHT